MPSITTAIKKYLKAWKFGTDIDYKMLSNKKKCLTIIVCQWAWILGV